MSDFIKCCNFVNHLKILILLALLLMHLVQCQVTESLSKWTEKCLSQCVCELDQMSKKAVICLNISFDAIPTRGMDNKVEVRTIKYLKI